jgi:hypothetical protein
MNPSSNALFVVAKQRPLALGVRLVAPSFESWAAKLQTTEEAESFRLCVLFRFLSDHD